MDVLKIRSNDTGEWVEIAALVGAPGKDGENGKDGAPGADGKTPVKGTDYWTAADKEEIVEDVLAALPAAEGVSV